MIDVGGENLPKAISSKSGAKLGKMYKVQGPTTNIETALKQVYIALNANPVIKPLNDGNYEVVVKFAKKFCPIGGANNPSRASIFQKNICIPYMRGFLNELFPQFIFGEDILNCIPRDDHRTCHYILKIEKKKV